MKDIPAEAILFDMYYGQRPSGALGRKEPPKVEFKPVDETASIPEFLFFRNITCNEAAKGMVRGIPEMRIKNILDR